jgi:hypothetical protein
LVAETSTTFYRLGGWASAKKKLEDGPPVLRPGLDRHFFFVFVFVLDFLRNQCEFIVWIDNFETQILKY